MEHRNAPDRLNEGALGPDRSFLRHRTEVVALGGVNTNLDQLVYVELGVHLGEDRVAEAAVAHPCRGLQRVGLSAQRAYLAGREGHLTALTTQAQGRP